MVQSVTLKIAVEEYWDRVEQLLKTMLAHHKLDIENIKKGDIQHIFQNDREYFVIYNKLCYELIREFDDSKLIVKLVPNQEYLDRQIEDRKGEKNDSKSV